MQKITVLLLSSLFMFTTLTACTSQAEKDRIEDRKAAKEQQIKEAESKKKLIGQRYTSAK